MTTRILLGLGLCLVACVNRQPVAEGPVHVADSTQRIEALQPLVAEGPTTEVCFEIVGMPHQQSNDGRLLLGDNKPTKATATLVGANTKTGESVHLELKLLTVHRNRTTCLWEHVGSAPEIRYDAVKISFA